MLTGCVCAVPLPLHCAVLWLLQVRVMEDSNLCAIHAKRWAVGGRVVSRMLVSPLLAEPCACSPGRRLIVLQGGPQVSALSSWCLCVCLPVSACLPAG